MGYRQAMHLRAPGVVGSTLGAPGSVGSTPGAPGVVESTLGAPGAVESTPGPQEQWGALQAPGAVGSREDLWEGVSEFLASNLPHFVVLGPDCQASNAKPQRSGGVGSPGASVLGGEAGLWSWLRRPLCRQPGPEPFCSPPFPASAPPFALPSIFIA